MLYIATFIYALSNGIVEAVINPVVATIYRDNKTHWLNILHAGWPGGLVLGGLLSIAVLTARAESRRDTSRADCGNGRWACCCCRSWCTAFCLFGQRFPTQERVEAGVSYREMLTEFGWGSAYIVSFLIIMGISQVLTVFDVPADQIGEYALVVAIVPAVAVCHSDPLVRPADVRVSDAGDVPAGDHGAGHRRLDSGHHGLRARTVRCKGTLFIVYTSAIMFVLRFFAGPIVHRISPLGLLGRCRRPWPAAACYGSAMRAPARFVLFLAATLYGFGKTFFWPTTLGVVSEQYPKGRRPVAERDQRRRHDRRRHARRPGHRHAAGHRLQPGRRGPGPRSQRRGQGCQRKGHVLRL